MQMQTQLEQAQHSPGGGGGEPISGGEIPEEDALLEILNGVGALRDDASPAKVDRFSPVEMVEEEQVVSGRRRQQMAAVDRSSSHEQPLPMRLSKEAPLAEILQEEENRAQRRRQLEAEDERKLAAERKRKAEAVAAATAERLRQQQQEEHAQQAQAQAQAQREQQQQQQGRALGDADEMVKLERLKAKLAALDRARDAGALDESAYVAARERVVAEAMAEDEAEAAARDDFDSFIGGAGGGGRGQEQELLPGEDEDFDAVEREQVRFEPRLVAILVRFWVIFGV